MSNFSKAFLLATGLLVSGLFGFAPSAKAEMQIMLYNGYSYNLDADFGIQQPNGTNMTLHDVESDSKSFNWDGGPFYYGGRIIYWMQNKPNWGFAVDYTHAKVAPNLNQTVRVSGTRDGVAVSGKEALNETVDKLEFTDGLNFLTFNALYRFSPQSKWVPYVGAGVGLSIPHVEFRRTDTDDLTFDYQVAGVAAQILAGVEYRLWEKISAFAEYKLSYAQVEGDLKGGGTLDTDIWTNHFTFGMSYHFDSHRRSWK